MIAKPEAANGTSYALVKDVSFRDGVIEVDLAGQPAAAAFAGARGFIGIAFRVQDDGRYEYIYLRPTNGRADDQVSRNDSTQYSSYPDFDFARSRREEYESYVDLQPGVWTKYKIEVEGRKARPFVNGAEQPCLIVNDLKLDPRGRRSRIVGRTGHRGLLFQSRDYRQVGGRGDPRFRDPRFRDHIDSALLN